MKKIIALVLAMVMVFALAACGDSGAAPTADPVNEPAADGTAAPANEPANEPAADQTLAEKIASAADRPVDTAAVKASYDAGSFKIGVILLHDENIGYDFAHLSGVKEAAANLGISEDQIIWKYNTPEDETCYDNAVDLAEQGCSVIFADSFGHESYMMQAAAEYPDILFVHASGQSAASCDLPNFVNIFTKVFESRYVSGVVAGMKLAEMIENGEITDPYVGYVGAYPYAEVVSGYTAFFLGVQSIVPEAHMDVTFTNSWADQTAEYEAANALMASGCVIIGQHADTTGAPSAVQAARDSGRNVYSVGYNVDMLSAAPTGALTSAQNNWGRAYEAVLSAAIKGESVPRNIAFGYENDGVQISTLGPSCAEGTAEKVAEVEEALKNGSLHVFDLASFTVNGEHISAYSSSYGFDGLELVWDGYFHESELMSAPLFDLAVDGITKLN